jgi:DNA-directed RNA polymerase subunit RPC12/RpoP
MKDAVRCPFCVLGGEFRPMVSDVDGYICNNCGHTTHPTESEYKCHCPNCRTLVSARALVAS